VRISRSEAQALLSKAKAEQEARARAAYASNPLLDQARVASEMLTGSPQWDVFLQRIQALIEQERTLLGGMAEALAIPNLTSEQVLQGQRHLLSTKAKIEAWEQVLRLPKEIIGAAMKSEPEKTN
jgi:primosomal protein N'